ncbi:hypothetical protein [Ornithinibacillus halotolerans]|uniref:Uncharacterized protein n=1 Tax=Ornithinibacillus halotolerans TaxID=1274357 RepID=A0A916RZM3_9BACI|nr:hypothetical protein [Ornithinibacillus halotolerans]GGA77239.1 hypothetical protein GCM10008025_21090 [Ornithinibacillus halotolerans]
MIDNILENQSYYFVDKEIVIVNHRNLLNLAIVRYVDSNKEFVVDINFIETKPSKERFISIKDIVGERNK